MNARPHRSTPSGLLMVAPSIAVVGVFVLYPVVRTAWLACFEQDPFGRRRAWVGLDQYRDVVTSAEFRHSLWVTICFVGLTVPASLALGVALAALANQQLRGMRVFRTIFASTIATSIAVASLLWIVLLQPTTGILASFLEAIGREPIDVLGDPETALVGVALTTIWQQLGLVFVITLAAMQSIPDALHESARLDGHGPVRRFVWITLPLLGPQLLFSSIVLTIASFQSFAQIDLLTEGGPRDATNVVVYSMVQHLPLDQGRAAVEAVLLFLVVGTFSAIQFRWLDRRVHYAD